MRNQGFSLVEVLVSLSITSISLVAITSSQLTTVQLSRQAAYEARANTLLRQIAGYI